MQKEWVSGAGDGRRCGAVSNGIPQMPQGHRPMAQAPGYTRYHIKILVGRPEHHIAASASAYLYPRVTLHKMQLCPLDPYPPTTCEKKLSKLSQRYE